MKLVVNARFLTQALTGVQRYALECSMQIRRMADDVVFVAPDAILYPELAAQLNVRIIGKLKGTSWEQIALYSFLKKNGCPPLLNLANTAPLLYHNNYLTIHDLAFFHQPQWNTAAFAGWYRFLIPIITRKARHLFTVSNTIKREIQHTLNIDSGKITVTYNGLAAKFSDQRPSLPKKKYIITVGTFNRRKNHDKIVHAFKSSSLSETYELLLIGNKEAIYRQIPIMDLAPRIRVITGLRDEELICLYQEAEILISLSAYEGFGLPVLEGLFFGCKVLCSDIPVYRELFDKYVYFCDPADMNDIIFKLSGMENDQSNSSLPAGLLEKYSYGNSAKVMLDTISGQTAKPTQYR